MRQVYIYAYLRAINRHPYIAARTTSTLGPIKKGEVMMRIEVSVPEAVFANPMLQAQVQVNESDIKAPVINAEVVSKAEGVLSKRLGMDIKLTVEKP